MRVKVTTVYNWVQNVWWFRKTSLSLHVSITNTLPQLHAYNLGHHRELGQPSHLAFIQSKHVEERQEEWYLGGENSGYLMLGVTTPQDSVSCFWFVVLLRSAENSAASSLLNSTLSMYLMFVSCLFERTGGSLIFTFIIKKTAEQQSGFVPYVPSEHIYRVY